MRKIKRLVLFCALLMVSTTVSAYSFYKSGIYYDITSSTKLTCAVTYKGKTSSSEESYSGIVNIPASVTYNSKTYSVTSIGHEAFFGCDRLKSVTIPNSVTTIGERAFWWCDGLTSIDIPNSVTSIGNYAFQCCSGLTSVKIPNSVTNIGESTFSDCSGLTSVTIPNSVTSIGEYAFDYCKNLIEVTLNSNSIVSKNYYSSGIKKIFGDQVRKYIIGNSVTSIGNYAFDGCSGLTSVTIPNSVTNIGESTFRDCSGLTEVHITDLDKWAEIEFASDEANPLYYAKNLYLNGELVTDARLGTATKIGDYAFYNYNRLKSIEIPDSVTIYGVTPRGMISIKAPNSITSIGEGAFYGCSGLSSVIIGNSVTSIEKQAFCNCSGLTSIEIPNSVTSIESYAFRGCNYEV